MGRVLQEMNGGSSIMLRCLDSLGLYRVAWAWGPGIALLRDMHKLWACDVWVCCVWLSLHWAKSCVIQSVLIGLLWNKVGRYIVPAEDASSRVRIPQGSDLPGYFAGRGHAISLCDAS